MPYTLINQANPDMDHWAGDAAFQRVTDAHQTRYRNSLARTIRLHEILRREDDIVCDGGMVHRHRWDCCGADTSHGFAPADGGFGATGRWRASEGV